MKIYPDNFYDEGGPLYLTPGLYPILPEISMKFLPGQTKTISVEYEVKSLEIDENAEYLEFYINANSKTVSNVIKVYRNP